MPLVRLSAFAWKWSVAILALATALAMTAEVSNGVAFMRQDLAGTLGAGLHDRFGATPNGQGTHFLRIDGLLPDSPLTLAGARPGDLLRFDLPFNRWRELRRGEVVGLTLIQPAGARHLVLQAQPAPSAVFAEQIDYWGRLAAGVLALLFGVLVAFTQPVGRAYRALALTFLAHAWSFFYSFTYSAPAPLATASKVIQLATYPMIFLCYVRFSWLYAPYRSGTMRRVLAAVEPAYAALALVTAACACWFALGNEAPALWYLTQITLTGAILLATLCLVDGWRNSTGEMRQRHLWLLLALSWGAIPPILTTVGEFDWTVAGARVTVLLYFAGQLLMFVLLAYAVLRHRVLHFNFMISRTLIYTVISVLLVGAFGLVEWVIAPMVHGGPDEAASSQPWRLVAHAALAVCYIFFARIHGRIEHSIEHLFFRSWYESAERLRDYVNGSGQFDSADKLLSSLTAALDHFTGHAGAAVYLLRPQGGFACAASTLTGAPAYIAPDDPLAIVLRSDLVPINPASAGLDTAGELALPSCHRGVLHCFVLLGTKQRGESYRPDEVEVLAFAVQQVGLGLYTLRVEMLERAVATLAERTNKQREGLRAMAGRRAIPHGRNQDLVDNPAEALE